MGAKGCGKSGSTVWQAFLLTTVFLFKAVLSCLEVLVVFNYYASRQICGGLFAGGVLQLALFCLVIWRSLYESSVSVQLLVCEVSGKSFWAGVEFVGIVSIAPSWLEILLDISFGIPPRPFSLLCVSDPRYFVFVFVFSGFGKYPPS